MWIEGPGRMVPSWIKRDSGVVLYPRSQEDPLKLVYSAPLLSLSLRPVKVVCVLYILYT